ncbi:chromosome partitioning protein ParB [Siculibacillus lacustris]|uniref:Chromosome partitioning protein ParB n=1 Tax=Siculibacillus lacustris TaxID=1549641 RepID=A0A4Q9VX31_9HYPH|nr:ParB-like protein [Siculibacillus lacustris]TBW40930.1 chromosome partitioning protein ParB [Siculibacillus lacustris]
MAQKTIAVADLRPTQLTLGLAEVSERAQKLVAMNAGDRRDYLARKAIPHVIGPGGRIFMVDHHHLVRALWKVDLEGAVLGDCLDDWSGDDFPTFWRRMKAAARCWPIDAEGNQRPFAAIPTHVKDLTDNPWRSLARRVRDRAFTDDDTPFQEFMWGDYFRSFMSRRLLEIDLDLAADLALKLARLDEAQDLPGFKD